MRILTYSVALVASWARMRRNGARTYKDPKARSAQDAHTLAMRASLSRSGLAWDPCGRFVVTVVYHPDDHRARGADRVLSLVLDAGSGVLWRDDSDKRVIGAPPWRADDDGHAWHMTWPDGYSNEPTVTKVGVARGQTLVFVVRIGDAKPPQKRAKRA